MSKKLIEWMEKDQSRARKWVLIKLTWAYLSMILAGLVLIAYGNVHVTGFLTLLSSFTSIYGVMIAFYCSTNPKTKDLKNP